MKIKFATKVLRGDAVRSLSLLVGVLFALSASAADRPNFLVIIADDMGFSDVGCYGGEIETPHLDGLAADGLRFTQFYNTSRCWPTRAALMTGYYPQQIRKDSMPGAIRGFGPSGKRPEWARTIAEHLRPPGYRTYHSGKWHIDGKPTKMDLISPIRRVVDRASLSRLRNRIVTPTIIKRSGQLSTRLIV